MRGRMQPRWTGANNEWPILISRGEPRRTDEQMVAALSDDVTGYLAGYTDEDLTSDEVRRVVDLIAEDYVYPRGSQGLQLQRDHLLAYVRVMRQRASAEEG